MNNVQPASGAALAGLTIACVAAPPEVHGLGLAAVSVLTAAAVILTSERGAASPASRWVWAAVPAGLFAIRAAIAPGEAVEPFTILLIAGLAGVAAASVPVSLDRAGALIAALAGLVSLRALYETAWGLAARAHEMVDATGAVLNRLEQGRPYAGFTTPAALGCFLAMALPPAVAWTVGRRGAWRVLGWSVVGAGGAALLATRSVTAMAALGTAVALAFLRRRLAGRVLAGAGLVLGLGIAAAAIARPDALLAPSRADSPWRLRAGNVRIALEIARDHPLAGVGPSGYAEAYPGYRRAGDNEARHAHDLPAELMAEWGIPGGLALAVAFFWIFVGPLVRARDGTPAVASGLGIGLAAFAIHNVADFTAYMPSLLVLAAVGRGLLAAPRERSSASYPSRLAWGALACVIAAVACGSGLAREALYDGRQAAVANDPAGAARAAARAERSAPWDADPPQFAAEAALAPGGGGVERALVEADRAVRSAPARGSARQTRARARVLSGDVTGAYADLVEAARLYPMSDAYAAQRNALETSLRDAAAQAPR